MTTDVSPMPTRPTRWWIATALSRSAPRARRRAPPSPPRPCLRRPRTRGGCTVAAARAVARRADERRDRARPRRAHLGDAASTESGSSERRKSPPETGGMSATSSPSASASSARRYALLRAYSRPARLGAEVERVPHLGERAPSASSSTRSRAPARSRTPAKSLTVTLTPRSLPARGLLQPRPYDRRVDERHDRLGHRAQARLHGGGRAGASSSRPASTRSRAGPTRTCTAAGRGRSASTRASPRPRRRTSASATCSSAGRPASRSPSTCRRSSGSTPTTRARSARSAAPGVAIDSLADMEVLLAGIPLERGLDLDDDQRARRAPAAPLRARRRGAGRGAGAAARHRPERHPQGVHRARELHLPAAALDAAHDRPLRVLRGADAALEHDLDLRLPHPRGRLDGGAGARVHDRERDRLLRGRGRRGALAGRVRRAALLLLQRAQPLLPGGGEVPRGAAALGAASCGALRRDEPEGARAALPRADRRLDADGAAAGEQRRPRRDPGALGDLRRGAVAAHERASTRRSRCRPSAPRGSRCARSRSSPARRAGPTPPIRSAGRTPSRR